MKIGTFENRILSDFRDLIIYLMLYVQISAHTEFLI